MTLLFSSLGFAQQTNLLGELPRTNTRIEAEADEAEVNVKSGAATLMGSVVVQMGSQNISAEKIEIDRSLGKMLLTDNIVISDSNISISGSEAEIAGRGEEVSFRDAAFVIHEQSIRGSAASLNRSTSEGLRVTNTSYTTCAVDNESWVLYADDLHIDEDTGRATAKGVKLEVFDVPVFYSPYASFIVDDRRASGFLIPDLSSGDQEGLQLSVPYYFNLAPNKDLTLAPKWVQNRGSGLEFEYRHLTENTMNSFASLLAKNDDLNPTRENRWAMDIEHQGSWGNFYSEIDYEKVSDENLFEDWDTEVIRTDSRLVFLDQNAKAVYEFDDWKIQMSYQGFQNIQDIDRNEYEERPRISMSRSFSISPNTSSSLFLESVSFDHAQNNTFAHASGFQRSDIDTWITGERRRAEVQFAWQPQTRYGYLKSELNFHSIQYNLDRALINHKNSSPSESAVIFSIDAGLDFERSTHWFGKNILQSLKPRMRAQISSAGIQNDMPLFDTDLSTSGVDTLFSQRDFIGGDRISQQDAITLGMTTEFIDSTAASYLGRLRMAQAFYFSNRENSLIDPIFSLSQHQSNTAINSSTNMFLQEITERENDKVTRNRSEMILDFELQPTPKFKFFGDFHFDHQKSKVQRAQLGLEWHLGTSSYLSAAYRIENNVYSFDDANENYIVDDDELRVDQIKQLRITVKKELSNRWGVFGKWHYDREQKASLNQLIGISYSGCCWNLSLAWREWQERDPMSSFLTRNNLDDSGIFIHFEFIGLGGVGRSASSLLGQR